MRRLLPLLVLLPVLLPAAAAAQASTEVLVRFAPGADARERGLLRSGADVRRAAVLPLGGVEVVAPEPGVGVTAAIRALEAAPGVRYAEPNARRRAFVTPDDELFGRQWALQNVRQAVGSSPTEDRGIVGADLDAPTAWDTTLGRPEVVTAVIDSGTDTTHPDLAGNLWRNPGEVAGNGLDDDANGLVDDVNGWNFADGTAQPVDQDGHGTHVAGIVGAVGGNARGISGVSPRGALMALRALDAEGSGTVADVVAAYAYAAREGARVANLSFGGDVASRTEREALAAASGVLFVAAAGNGGEDGVGDDTDVAPTFPCAHELPNVVCVGASDRSDRLPPFSNRGARTVDLAAPGVRIASTLPVGTGDPSFPGYGLRSGTSMAAPQVTGVAALALAREPRLTVAQLREVLLGSVEAVPALAGVTATGGRVDAARAVAAAGAVVAPGQAAAPPAASPPEDAPAPPGATPPPGSPAPPAGSPAPGGGSPPASPATGAAGPAFSAPRVRAPDRTAPTLGLTAVRAIRTPRLRSTGLRPAARCSEACTLTATLTLDAATARRLGLRSRRVATATARVGAAGSRTLVLRPTRTVRGRLRGAGRAVLRLQARDLAGNVRVRTLGVALRP